ncbi:MAG: WD40/YVTN/BNR-like repeat-containing protein, partial [Cyclobacteriaceae bacterium]
MRSLRFILLPFLLVIFSFGASQLEAQKRKTKEATLSFDESLYGALQWRNIGPFRGGRSAAVTGVPGEPNLFYFGSTGGGVWRTKDGGSNWENISDGFFGGSIGAVAVSDYDLNVIYVGGGEKTVRGNVSYGYGIWKSLDAGKTWQSIGLEDSRHVSRIRIHPKNPDLVYAAVMGNLFAPSKTRGVYRSKDGGGSWEQVLFANERAGAVDLILDPN